MANDLSINGDTYEGVEHITVKTIDGQTVVYVDGTAFMKLSIYDKNEDGVVDEAAKVTNKLTIGDKSFDGSESVNITAADLDVQGVAGFTIKICENDSEYNAITPKDSNTIYLIKG